MKFVTFPEANIRFGPPPELPTCETVDACMGMDTAGRPITVTVCELEAKDIALLLATKRIYIFHYGHGLPPHAVDTLSPFQTTEEVKEQN